MHKNYETEARNRWGNTQAYSEFTQKTAAYSAEQWSNAAQALDEVFARFGRSKRSAEPADSEAAQALVAELKRCISENYYTCTDEILYGLGQMYVADERFRNNIDKHAEGTAQYVCDAIAVHFNKVR